MSNYPESMKLMLVILMWYVLFYFFGPYLWRQAKIWLMSCPFIDHSDGCDCAACQADAPRMVNGRWTDD